ncbi:MAG: hypothetical protein IJE43_23645 [Alphaproteobacteria bacterium]|nr:hypothetical protein [Alphaproteobacteria bacterium]
MKINKKRRAIFFAVSNDERRENLAFSNFVFSLCKVCMQQKAKGKDGKEVELSSIYDVDEFVRHDMIVEDNIRESVFKSLVEYDAFIFLIDEVPLDYKESSNKTNQTKRVFNPNVWFEMGIAAPQTDKTIIIISLFDENPFYVKDVQHVRLNPTMLEEFFFQKLDNENWAFSNPMTAANEKRMLEQMQAIYNDASCGATNAETAFMETAGKIQKKLIKAQNPFSRDMDTADVEKQMRKIGAGSVADLLETIVHNTTAEFIPGEENAFSSLIQEVRAASSSLRTTRFANQSICSDTGKSKVETAHKDFMDTLCKMSKMDNIDSIRIICNNHYTKWKDVLRILKDGGNVSVYIRKAEYNINFELVIIDKSTTFIHFYQLSGSGDQSFDVQKINSTLKLVGKDVAENMDKIFTRLYQREDGDPSRTLLGIPKKTHLDDGIKSNGLITIPITDQNDDIIYKRIVLQKFEEWFEHMEFEDAFFMGVGLYIYSEDSGVRSEIINFIKGSKDKDKTAGDFKKKIQQEIDDPKQDISPQTQKGLQLLYNALNT